MHGTYLNVSGIDPHDGAKVVFVWSRTEDRDHLVQVASGQVVRGEGGLPPGIRVGQFSVTFLLPPGCAADSVGVTDDKFGKEFLPGVTVELLSIDAAARPEAAAASPVSPPFSLLPRVSAASRPTPHQEELA